MQTQCCQAGMIIRATAGRDAGRFLLVTAFDGKDVFLADGEQRKLANPKRKNPRHVQATNHTLDLKGLTDAALRRALQPLQPQKSAQTRCNQTRKEVIVDVEAGCN
ncbi:MAG: KOW domain-containing RNA-binding protein [Oscillospiraceae bacterium]|nr:KOW domain-containing RNA-binding protein [Oscillospiraceae bacterium]